MNMNWTASLWGPDIFADMRRLQREMDRLVSSYGEAKEAFPAINLWSNADQILVKAEVPGVNPKDLDVSVQNDLLTIQGERKSDVRSEDVVCHRAERGMGRFLRTVRLPFEVDVGKVSAETVNGVLTLTLPRAEAGKPRRIQIQAG